MNYIIKMGKIEYKSEKGVNNMKIEKISEKIQYNSIATKIFFDFDLNHMFINEIRIELKYTDNIDM